MCVCVYISAHYRILLEYANLYTCHSLDVLTSNCLYYLENLWWWYLG